MVISIGVLEETSNETAKKTKSISRRIGQNKKEIPKKL